MLLSPLLYPTFQVRKRLDGKYSVLPRNGRKGYRKQPNGKGPVVSNLITHNRTMWELIRQQLRSVRLHSSWAMSWIFFYPLTFRKHFFSGTISLQRTITFSRLLTLSSRHRRHHLNRFTNLGPMEYSSDEESDFSDSEISEYKEKPYEELRSGKYKVKNVNGTLRSPFWAGKKKQEFKYKEREHYTQVPVLCWKEETRI